MNCRSLGLYTSLSQADQQAVSVYGAASLILMENAGRAVADTVRPWQLQHPGKTVVVLCGTGNNGGDGLVTARHLAETFPHQVVVLLNGSPKTDNARFNLQYLKSFPVNILELNTLSYEVLEGLLQSSSTLVDALIGAGLRQTDPTQPLPQPLLALIRQVNQHKQRDPKAFKLFAVDLPTGVNARTGHLLPDAFLADETITLVAAKPGLYLHAGRYASGFITIAPIGMPPGALAELTPEATLLDKATLSLPVTNPMGHKYGRGHVLVIAGSNAMHGAAQLCGYSALKAGAGLVTMVVPQGFQPQHPEWIVHLMPTDVHGHLQLTLEDIKVFLANRVSAVLVGPGLGCSQTEPPKWLPDLLHHCLERALPCVMDADALNAMALLAPSDIKRLASHPNAACLILTPHLGEAARLLQQSTNAVAQDLLTSVERLFQQYPGQIVLKSSSTVLQTTSPAGTTTTWINPYGHPGMATAGSGDVLAGIIASFAAQGLSPEDAAKSGTVFHSLCGELAARSHPGPSFTASDLVAELGNIYHEFKI